MIFIARRNQVYYAVMCLVDVYAIGSKSRTKLYPFATNSKSPAKVLAQRLGFLAPQFRVKVTQKLDVAFGALN